MATHMFLGLDATSWRAAVLDPEGIPTRSPMIAGTITPQDVSAGIAAMLERLDAGEPI